MLLYIIRHGDPNYETDSLTPLGKLQAEAVSKRLAVHGLDRIYTSPLGRAKETAMPTCKLLGIDYVIEDWCSENTAWESFSFEKPDGGRSWCFQQQNTELRNDNTLKLGERWYEAEALKCIDGKAGYDKLISSSDEFLERLGYKREGSVYRIIRPNDERVAVFCHQGFGITWISHLLNIYPHIFWAGFDIAHTGVSIFQFENYENGLTAPKCLCMSDISHIYKENLPMRYNHSIDI